MTLAMPLRNSLIAAIGASGLLFSLPLPTRADETPEVLRVAGGAETLARLLGDVDPDPARFLESLNRRLLAEIPTSDDWERNPRRVEVSNYLADIAELEERFGRRIEVGLAPEARWERFRDLVREMGFDVQRDGSTAGGLSLVAREGDLAGRRRRLAQALRWDLLATLRTLGRGAQVFELPDSWVPSPAPLRDWNVWTNATRLPITRSTALGALVRDQRLGLVLEGRRHLSAETRQAFDRAGLFSGIYRSSATAFFRYAEGFEVRGGQLVVPGGRESSSIWQELAGETPTTLGTFVPALLTRRGGRVAFLWHALFELPAPLQKEYLDPRRVSATLNRLGDSGSEGFLGPYGGDGAWSARLRSEAADAKDRGTAAEIDSWWEDLRDPSVRQRAEGGAELVEHLARLRRLPVETLAEYRSAWRDLHRRRVGEDGDDAEHSSSFELGDPRLVVSQLSWLGRLLGAVAVSEPASTQEAPGRGPLEQKLLRGLAPVLDPQHFELDGVGFAGHRGLDSRHTMASSLIEQAVVPVDELISAGRVLSERWVRAPKKRRDRVERGDLEALSRLSEELRVVLVGSAYLPALARAEGPIFRGRSLLREHWLQGPLREVSAGLADYLDLGGENADASAFQDASRIRRAFSEGLLGDWDSLTPEVSRRVADLIARGEAVLRASGDLADASRANLRGAGSVVPAGRLERAVVGDQVGTSISWSERLAVGLAATEFQSNDGGGRGLGGIHAAGVAMPRVFSLQEPVGRGRPWVGRWPSYESLAHDRWTVPLEERGVVDLKLAVVRFLGRRGLRGNVGPDLMAAVIADLRTVRSEGPRDWESWVRFSSALDDSYFEAKLRGLLEQGLYQLE